MVIDGSTIRPIRDILTDAAMFYDETARQAFNAIAALVDREAPVDILSVHVEAKGGADMRSYLGECLDVLPNAAHAQYYAKLVADAYRDREIIAHATRLVNTMAGGMGDYQAILGKISAEVMAKEALESPATFDYSKDLVTITEALEAQKERETIDTGFRKIDGAWRGAMAGEINTWGAATNVGKSVTLLNIAHNAARTGRRVLYVGTEMTAVEAVSRHLSMVSGVPAWKLRVRKKLEKHEVEKAVEALGGTMQGLPIHILDHPEPNLAQIEAAIVASKAEVVLLDYLERFTLPRAENLRLQIKEFMRRLKTLARRRNVLIHLAAQLGRTTYGAEERAPTLADLSESNAIEKESDRVVLLWRPKAKQTGRTIIEAIGAKNRHGKRGSICNLILDDQTLKLYDGEEEKQEDFNRED